MSIYETLTTKQQAFVDYYLKSSNATEAARLAGYAHPMQQGHRLLRNVEIQEALQERGTSQNLLKGQRIAEANEVLVYLTDVMEGRIEASPVQLRAAELLGKRYALWREREGEDLPELGDPPYDPMKNNEKLKSRS